MKKIFAVLGLACAIGASEASAAPFTNGDFSVSPGVFTVLSAGDSTSLPGWVVGSGTVEYIGDFGFQSPLPGKSDIDLDGVSVGSIYQNFDTVTGATYNVSFYLGGNPTGVVVKRLQVSAGDYSQEYTFDTTGRTFGDIGWIVQSFSFTALADTTQLLFQSLNTSGAAGALIGVVSVTGATEVPEPSTIGLLAGALSMAGIFRLRRRKQA